MFCLGDSFTEGVGSLGDSSYPKILQTLVSDSIQVYNAGISGLDPFYSYYIFSRQLLKYKPNCIVVAINQTDISDFIRRGGFERFSGKTVDKNPKWEWFYANFFSVRYFVNSVMNYNRLFLLPKEEIEEEEKAKLNLKSAVDSFATLCKSEKIDLYFIFHPMRQETLLKKMDCQEIADYCVLKNIKRINVLNFFMKNGVDSLNTNKFFWPIDGHYNNRGYRLMAKAIATNIKEN